MQRIKFFTGLSNLLCMYQVVCVICFPSFLKQLNEEVKNVTPISKGASEAIEVLRTLLRIRDDKGQSCEASIPPSLDECSPLTTFLRCILGSFWVWGYEEVFKGLHAADFETLNKSESQSVCVGN